MRTPNKTAARGNPALIPLTPATVFYKMSREMLLRRVQRGEIEGECRDGRWFVADPRATTSPADTRPGRRADSAAIGI